MTFVTAPPLNVKSIQWQLDQPGQVNANAWTGTRIAVTDPWHGKWAAKVTLAPIVGEANVRKLRSFLAKCRGSLNTFRIYATEGPQNANTGVTVASTVAAGSRALTISGAATALLEGQFVTINGQLLQLTADQAGSTIAFEPMLRQSANSGTTVVTSRPYALVYLTASSQGWQVDAGQVYGLGFDVSEAIMETDGAVPESGAAPSPPVLSSATASASGTTGATLGVTTDTGNGTLFWTVDTSATTPTSAQIMAGQDATGAAAAAHGSQAVSATGAQSASATGLTASTTYYAHYAQENTMLGISVAITSASFATGSASTLATPAVTNVSAAGATPLVLALSDGDYVAGKYGQWEITSSKTPAKNADGSYTTTTQKGVAFIDGDSWARLDEALGYGDPSGDFAFHIRILRDNPSGAVTATDSLGNTFNADASAWSTDYTDTIVWTPASLFLSSEQGYVFDPSSTSNFFQDSAGTTAGAFGSPIGLLKDVSGKGHDFSQATAGKRPAAVSPGWVNFDGASSVLSLAQAILIGGTTGASIIMAVNAAAQGTTKVWWGEQNTGSTNAAYRPGTMTDNATAKLWESDDSGGVHLNAVDTLLAVLDGSGHVLSVTDTLTGPNGSVNVWKDRAAASTNPVAYTRSGTTTLNVTGLGANKTVTDNAFFAGKIGRAIFINRPLTPTERANAEAWCASPYGITLP